MDPEQGASNGDGGQEMTKVSVPCRTDLFNGAHFPWGFPAELPTGAMTTREWHSFIKGANMAILDSSPGIAETFLWGCSFFFVMFFPWIIGTATGSSSAFAWAATFCVVGLLFLCTLYTFRYLNQKADLVRRLNTVCDKANSQSTTKSAVWSVNANKGCLGDTVVLEAGLFDQQPKNMRRLSSKGARGFVRLVSL